MEHSQKDGVLRAWMVTFLFRERSQTPPNSAQCCGNSKCCSRFSLPRAMQNQQQCVDFSMEQLPCNESFMNNVSQAADSCQWIQEIFTMCIQRKQINVILDFKYVPNVVLLALFHKLDEINLASWSNTLMWWY